MNILYIVLTYNRPKITSSCLSTVLNNSLVKPSEMVILDDGSSPEMQKSLLSFAQEFKNFLPITVSLKNRNFGVGWAFQEAYETIERKNPDIVAIIESDYIFRKNWLDEVLAVFEAAPYTIAIPGTSHPDMIDRTKTHLEFSKLMVQQFGVDVDARQYMYSPFDLNTKLGKIKVQGVSNSCGCQILHWKRINDFLFINDEIKKEWNHWIDRACHKWGGEPHGRQRASDAHMSGTPTFFWERWAKANNIDISKNFAWLDIFDYSISSHRCIGGINGIVPGMQEGDTFLLSNGWDNKYLTESPRK